MTSNVHGLLSDQTEMNRKAYASLRLDLEMRLEGYTALLHNGELIRTFEEEEDAYDFGCEEYGLGEFSVIVIGKDYRVDIGAIGLAFVPPNNCDTMEAAD